VSDSSLPETSGVGKLMYVQEERGGIEVY
jgi:hypothetical protein